MNRPVIVANCSGFFGDRISAARELVDVWRLDPATMITDIRIAQVIREDDQDVGFGGL